MKSSKLTLVACFISLICVFNMGLVSALAQDDITVAPSWTVATASKGGNAFVTIRLTNSISDELTIYRVGIHFDWLDAGRFFTLDLTDNPEVISGYGSHIFSQMTIQIPSNVSTGSHTYYIALDGVDSTSSESFSWDSSEFTLEIVESSSGLYDALRQQVSEEITAADNAEYQNADAQSLLEQAKEEYGQALALAQDNKIDEAVTTLQHASSLLDQAETAEQQDGTQSSGLQTLIMFLVAGAVVAVVVGVAIALFLRKKDREEGSMVDDYAADDSAVDQSQAT